MPKLKRTHINSRSIICIICRNKIFKKGRVLNNGTKLLDLLRGKYQLLNDYDPDDMTRPNALCPTCCSDLYNSDNDKQHRSPPLLKRLVPILISMLNLRLCTHERVLQYQPVISVRQHCDSSTRSHTTHAFALHAPITII